MPVDDRNAIEPKDGYDIVSTIDINLQDVAEQALLKQLQKVDAQHGCAILMEVKTGDIKAITNLKRNADGSYSENYNFAIGESTEPGSTFKLASLIVALEDGYIDINDTVDTEKGEIKYYGIKLTDSKEGGYGKITVKQAFAVSSNVGISKIITKYYKGNEKKFVERLYSMKLNEKLGIEIDGEGEPFIKYPGKGWSGISLPWMSIGYEVRLTPLQILAFYNAIANDGRLIKPKFVKSVVSYGKTVKTFDTEIISPSICSRRTIKYAKEMLEEVVKSGTAKNLLNSNYMIAGKTGTARIANKKYGYYHETGFSYQASFVGYFPADNPKYSCIVVVNSPSQQIYYGNLVAGPVFKEIADKVYATSIDLIPKDKIRIKKPVEIPFTKSGFTKETKKVLRNLHIPYIEDNLKSDWIYVTRTDEKLELQNRFIKNGLVPNVIGMGAKDAVFILENAGLNVEINGCGSVINQSLSPGSEYRKGDYILIKLG